MHLYTTMHCSLDLRWLWITIFHLLHSLYVDFLFVFLSSPFHTRIQNDLIQIHAVLYVLLQRYMYYCKKHYLTLIRVIKLESFRKLSQKHKQEGHGHIARLRKQFKSINIYDYIITLIKRKKHYKVNENLLVLHLKKLECLSSKDACAKIG